MRRRRAWRGGWSSLFGGGVEWDFEAVEVGAVGSEGFYSTEFEGGMGEGWGVEVVDVVVEVSGDGLREVGRWWSGSQSRCRRR